MVLRIWLKLSGRVRMALTRGRCNSMEHNNRQVRWVLQWEWNKIEMHSWEFPKTTITNSRAIKVNKHTLTMDHQLQLLNIHRSWVLRLAIKAHRTQTEFRWSTIWTIIRRPSKILHSNCVRADKRKDLSTLQMFLSRFWALITSLTINLKILDTHS